MAKENHLRSDRVVDAILEYINTNGLEANSPLPPERHMSEMWQVSRGTVRDAIARMCREGILYTIHGKGSFVAPDKEEINMKDMISFSGAFRSQGKQTGSRVIKQKICEADGKVARMLNISEGVPVHVLSRMREVDGRELMIEISYIPVEKCPGIEKFNFEKASLYNVLEIHYGIYMSYQDITVRLSKATAKEAHQLGVEPGEPVFVENAVAYSGAEAVEYTKSIAYAKRAVYAISIGE